MTMELFNKFKSEEEIDEYIDTERIKEVENVKKSLFLKWDTKKKEIKNDFKLEKDIINAFDKNKDILLDFIEKLHDGKSVDIVSISYHIKWSEIRDCESKINQLPIDNSLFFIPNELERDKDNLIHLLDIKNHEISISDLYNENFRKEKDFKLFIGNNCIKISIIVECDIIDGDYSFDKDIMIYKFLRIEKLLNIDNLSKI